MSGLLGIGVDGGAPLLDFAGRVKPIRGEASPGVICWDDKLKRERVGFGI